EHKPEYAERTRRLIRSHGLDAFVDVRDAPLVYMDTPHGKFQWYEFDVQTLNLSVELLVVDGPPGDTSHHARYPTLPLTTSKLASTATVVLDDMDRRDERETVEFWLEEHPSLTREDSPNSEIAVLSFSSDNSGSN